MPSTDAKLIYLTAGAAGMYCGSCMHDNALAKALSKQGWDIQLVPTYTPIRTDESDFSVDHVLFGGLNVYLQQKVPFFRYLPSFVDRFLDNPKLIRRMTANSKEMDPKMLGSLAVSMLKGPKGNQRKEVFRMCRWLAEQQPDLVIFTNVLIGGCIEQLKKDLGVPILVTLQGDDVFLDSLEEPYRSKCFEQISQIVKHVDGFIVHSEFFKGYMAEYFSIDASRIHVTPLGLDVDDFESYLEEEQSEQPVKSTEDRVIGYMARLAPEKGFESLVDAFIELKQQPSTDNIQLKIAGWLGPENKNFANDQFAKMDSAGLGESYEYLGSIERSAKLELFAEIDVLCVPTKFQEPKGLYVLEAMAAGVPVVQPAHGAFPELIKASGGGVLVSPNDATALAQGLMELLSDPEKQKSLGQSGQRYVHQHRNSISMANATAEVIQSFLP